MEMEDTVQTEQSELTGTPEGEGTAFDEGWDDDGQPAFEEAAETEEGSEGTEADADQQDAEGTEGEGSDGETSAEGAAKGKEGSPDQGEVFTLKHLGEERTVGRDEVIKLAQQGMDYDRIREKWDAVKDDVPKLRMYEDFLKELADSRGSDIESLIDETRTRAMIARAEAKGEKLDPASAAAMAVRARMQPGQGSESRSDAGTEAQGSAMIADFIAAYGETVRAEDIPKEVWEEAAKTGNLVLPYQRYVNKELEAENKRLKEEVEQAKQQRKNKERSTGSSKSEGAAAARDAFDEGWDS